jgi:hypothetical protein
LLARLQEFSLIRVFLEVFPASRGVWEVSAM